MLAHSTYVVHAKVPTCSLRIYYMVVKDFQLNTQEAINILCLIKVWVTEREFISQINKQIKQMQISRVAGYQ